QAGEGTDRDGGARGSLLEQFRDEGLDHLDALLGREERVFSGMAADGDNELVEEGAAADDDVQMSVCNGVEGAGVEGEVVHPGNSSAKSAEGESQRARGVDARVREALRESGG